MSIVAHSYRFVIGVDTHARNHVLAAIAADTGARLGGGSFPANAAGMGRALAWARGHAGGPGDTLWVIEGAASYGAILAGAVTAAGYRVAEAPRMDARNRHGVGKSDPIDAARMARAALGLPLDRLRTPRQDDGIRAALQVLLTVRDRITDEKTRTINALTALARGHDLGIDARKPLTTAQTATIARMRRRDEPIATDTARQVARDLARRAIQLTGQATDNAARIAALVAASPAAPLLAEPGIGPVTAATCLTAYSHPGRVRSEAAFASLAGVNPIPASSGNTTRHRLNRGGDRRLNRALHVIALNRMIHDPETRAYTEKRREQGKTDREIRRCLKRYIARHTYRVLNQTNPTPTTT